MTDLTPIINAAIALLAAIITAFVVPWLKGKTTKAEREDLQAWVNIAVAAAEQLYDAADGEAKKAFVMNYLTSKDFSVDLDSLELAIESAVLELHHQLYSTAAEGKIDGGGK